MSHPKILILFTTYNECADDEPRYGMLTPGRDFFRLLQEHLEVTMTFFRTVPGAMTARADRGVDFRFRELCTEWGTGHLEFISRTETVVERSGESIEDLLAVCAEDLLRPGVPPEATLMSAEQPVVLDFEAWHRALFDSAYFEGSADEFWAALKAQCVPLRGERLVIGMPMSTYGRDVKLETLPYFTFEARHKHSDADCDWTSMQFPMQQFIQGIGDVVLSRLG